MSRKPERKDRNPKTRASREEREHQAANAQGEALAECYRILMEAGAIKPKGGGGVT